MRAAPAIGGASRRSCCRQRQGLAEAGLAQGSPALQGWLAQDVGHGSHHCCHIRLAAPLRGYPSDGGAAVAAAHGPVPGAEIEAAATARPPPAARLATCCSCSVRPSRHASVWTRPRRKWLAWHQSTSTLGITCPFALIPSPRLAATVAIHSRAERHHPAVSSLRLQGPEQPRASLSALHIRPDCKGSHLGRGGEKSLLKNNCRELLKVEGTVCLHC